MGILELPLCRKQAVLNAYLITLSALVVAQISPGPSLLAVAGAALGQGFRSAFFVALGVATAILAWFMIAALGLAGLLKLYPSLRTVIKVLGGGYLCFLAAKSLAAAIRGAEPSIRATAEKWTPAAAWKRGFLVNITNPTTALALSALATFLYGPGLSTPQVIGFAPIGFLSSVAVFGLYGVMFSSGFARRTYARSSRFFEVLFSFAFVAVGGKLVIDAVAEVIP